MDRTVVLVEGLSDKAALEALAERMGRDLAKEGVTVVSMGGATNIGHHLDDLGSRRRAMNLAGLCDAAEEALFRRALERAGLGSHLDRAALEAIGFFVCDPDLEAELISALGPASVQTIIEEQGELSSWRIFQRQPAQRGRPVEAQLRRFMGTR
ncbi:MAG: ATP-dependent endonuclease, partial [Acidimicrobiia bacterium]|nr:ATP-dependent endonuclease [Acidimicrobiia bacterium]